MTLVIWFKSLLVSSSYYLSVFAIASYSVLLLFLTVCHSWVWSNLILIHWELRKQLSKTRAVITHLVNLYFISVLVRALFFAFISNRLVRRSIGWSVLRRLTLSSFGSTNKFLNFLIANEIRRFLSKLVPYVFAGLAVRKNKFDEFFILGFTEVVKRSAPISVNYSGTCSFFD